MHSGGLFFLLTFLYIIFFLIFIILIFTRRDLQTGALEQLSVLWSRKSAVDEMDHSCNEHYQKQNKNLYPFLSNFLWLILSYFSHKKYSHLCIICVCVLVCMCVSVFIMFLSVPHFVINQSDMVWQTIQYPRLRKQREDKSPQCHVQFLQQH